MSDPSIVAAYEAGFAIAAKVSVTFQRIVGQAPNVVVTSFTVNAVVREYLPDTQSVNQTGFAASKIGAITQGDRQVIVLASDLSNLGFPLPVKKNDKILLVLTGELLNITSVDPFKRLLGGAIDIIASGVN